MTGLGVERMQRTMHPLPSVPPVSATTPMPPHIQGAERRQERPAQRTASRWGLRVLVIGSLAGAAWLLTGAAAHAADRNDGPTGSLLGAVVGGDTMGPVTGLLQTAVQPLEAVSPAYHQHHHEDVVSTVLDLPRRVLTRPVGTVAEIVHGSTGIKADDARSDVAQVPAEIPEPIRPVGGRPEKPPAAQAKHEPAILPDVVLDDPAPTLAVRRISAAPAAAVKVSAHSRHEKAQHKHRTVRPAHHRPAAHAAIPAEAAQTVSPGGEGPAAPLQLHLGDSSGSTSTSGSGTQTEGGSAAFLPAAIAHSTMACCLLPIAPDVEVRRRDAEAPTVSPD